MEAKDTVMNLHEILEAIKYEDGEVGINKFNRTAQAQAEITGKIMKQEGIKEVVEWGNEWCNNREHKAKIGEIGRRRRLCTLCWQAKLKEWG